jgi:hypothetical protein
MRLRDEGDEELIAGRCLAESDTHKTARKLAVF